MGIEPMAEAWEAIGQLRLMRLGKNCLRYPARITIIALQYSIHAALHSLSFWNDLHTPASRPQNLRHYGNCIRSRNGLFLRSYASRAPRRAYRNCYD
jgi:hypothetical protein